MDYKKEILRVTAPYLYDDLEIDELLHTTKEYKAILEELAGHDLNVDQGRTDLLYDNGKAIGAYWAAYCVDDMVRTRQFIKGIDRAIKDKLLQKEELHILYAGTGPFATLLLPLILKYNTHKIRYTLLEINPWSFEIMKQTISKLNLEESQLSYVNDDATSYQIGENNQPDIIISETMQNALIKEQQVPIFMNLMNQVSGDTIFIPEKIQLHFGLNKSVDSFEQFHPKNINPEVKVFEVSKSSFYPQLNTFDNQSLDPNVFNQKEHVISKEDWKNYDCLLLLTKIIIYKNIILDYNASGLTIPKFIDKIDTTRKAPINIITQYIISEKPELKFSVKM